MTTIRRVWKNNGNGQLLVSVPNYMFKEGDYVKIQGLKEEEEYDD